MSAAINVQRPCQVVVCTPDLLHMPIRSLEVHPQRLHRILSLPLVGVESLCFFCATQSDVKLP